MRMPGLSLGNPLDLKKPDPATDICLVILAPPQFTERSIEAGNLAIERLIGVFQGQSEDFRVRMLLDPCSDSIRYKACLASRAERTPSQAAGIGENDDTTSYLRDSEPSIRTAGFEIEVANFAVTTVEI